MWADHGRVGDEPPAQRPSRGCARHHRGVAPDGGSRGGTVSPVPWPRPRPGVPGRSPVPIYLVGQPYVAGRMRWPPAARYSYRRDGHELILFVRGVTDRQEADLRRGQAELALVVDARAIVLCSRFGATLPWSHAAPYRWCGVPRAERGVPPAPELMPDCQAQLRVALVEADDGRVRA